MSHDPSNSPPRVSVVVAVHGNVPALTGLVAALARQDFPTEHIELVVVDNHPTPTFPGSLPNAAGLTHVVLHEPQAGLSRARNTGIRHARGEFILITDPDSRPDRSWVRQLVDALEDTGAYCAGGKVTARFTGPTPPTLSAGVLALFVPPAWPDRVVALGSPFWLVGCNLAARRDPVPRFDERLGARPGRHLSCEDLEFVVRADRTGLAVVVAPEAVVHRAIHPADLRAASVLGRAFWHGVSIARLIASHPGAQIYDSYRVRDALAALRSAGWLSGMADVARIVGLRAEKARLAVRTPRGARVDDRPVAGVR